MMKYYETDFEFMKIMEHFVFEEVVNEPGQELPEDTRYLAILAALLGCQGLDVYREILPRALDGGLITFCFLMAQGGCEPQLAAHAKGNMNLGNDKDFLVRVVSQCLPYIGYPRSLNAISCVNKAAE